jgi:murein biosynthesis integral membrane protein MurJ
MIKTITRQIGSNPIIKSSIAIGVITMAVKMLGYVEKVILAYFFGTGYEVDVYSVIVTIVFSIFVFFREVIEPGFLNSFLKARNSRDDDGAWRLFNTFIRYIFLITVTLSVLVYIRPSAVIDAFAPGFEGERRELAVTLIQLGFPACIFLALSALTNITLNSLKRFALPASGELVLKVCVILCLFFLYKTWGIKAAIVGLLIGAALKLCTHLLALHRQVSFRAAPGHADYLRNAWSLSWPLLIGVLFSQASKLVDNAFASSQQEGAISALSYASKLVEFPVLVFPYILSVVVFPYLAELSIQKEKAKLARLLAQSLSWITLIFLPLSVFYFVYCHQIVDLVFKRGAFDEYSVILTSDPLRLYSAGMVFFAIETVLVIFYFANANTKLPILVGIICVVENILLTYLFIHLIGYTGIALAAVISKATKNIVLLILLKREVAIDYKAVGRFFYKVALACAAAALVIMSFKTFFPVGTDASLPGKLFSLGAAFAAGALVYAACLFLLRFKFGTAK